MSVGTGNLPNDNNTVDPFEKGTSEWANNVKANIDALADGSGIGDQAIKSHNVDFETFVTNPKYMQVGSGASSIATGFSTTSVTFDTPFDNTPAVFMNVNSSSGAVSYYTVSTISTTGFNFLMEQSSGIARGFNYVALDITQPPFISSS